MIFELSKTSYPPTDIDALFYRADQRCWEVNYINRHEREFGFAKGIWKGHLGNPNLAYTHWTTLPNAPIE